MFYAESWYFQATRTVKHVALGITSVFFCWSSLNLNEKAMAARFSVLWWDTTNHTVHLGDAVRQEIPTFLDSFTIDGEDIFDTTYISHHSPGGLAAHLASHHYDAVVLDTDYRGQTFPFGAADQEALKQYYKNRSNLLFDATLMIRSMNYIPQVDFPGPNNAFGNFTANEVYALAKRGGGIIIGTDHHVHHADANFMLDTLLPGVAFIGETNPSTNGVFYGSDLLNSAVEVAPIDIFNHWSSIPSQGIAPKGTFTDFLGNPVTLYTQVEVADKPGYGYKHTYISSSWKPDACTTTITGKSSACYPPVPEPLQVPEPSAVLGLLAVGTVGSLLQRR